MISTHTPLAGRDDIAKASGEMLLISTHTPLAGRDREIVATIWTIGISTHTPLAGRDDLPLLAIVFALLYFNSHAPCGARR